MSIIHCLFRVISVIAVCYLANSSAYPTNNDAGWAEGKQNKSAVEVRAPQVAGATVIPLYRDVEPTTWIGFRVQPGLFGGSVSDAAVRETARKTYESIETQLPWSMTTALLAVIYVPGGGWAAGTIWYGTETAFQNYAQNSQSFWNSVPGHQQGLLNWAESTHPWHAEAVAAAKAEQEFGNKIAGGRWPQGTKIFTYGRVRGGAAGAKAVCVPRHTSVAVSCGEWLERLGLNVVPMTG